MKSMKGKLLKKLKTIKTIGYVKPDRILHANAADGYVPNSPPKTCFKAQNRSTIFLQEETKKITPPRSVQDQEPEIIDVSELMKDLEAQEIEIDTDGNDKENIRPQSSRKDPVFMRDNLESLSTLKPKNESLMRKDWNGADTKYVPLAEINGSRFRRPNLDSGTLFDPSLLEAFEQAVMEVKVQEAERRATIEDKIWQGIDEEQPLKARKIEEITDPLLNFEEKCPPGGSDSVILYTTGLRGIRKTFEDCQSIRFLLENFRVLFFERDISMHLEFRDELWQIFGGKKVVPPRLFIKGRYIGGAEEVFVLHEQGRLRPLLEGIPIDSSNGYCEGCAGVRFIMCHNCNGSRKITPEDGDGESINCPQCNENGLLVCPMCC